MGSGENLEWLEVGGVWDHHGAVDVLHDSTFESSTAAAHSRRNRESSVADVVEGLTLSKNTQHPRIEMDRAAGNRITGGGNVQFPPFPSMSLWCC
jgi:hypothetical protein